MINRFATKKSRPHCKFKQAEQSARVSDRSPAQYKIRQRTVSDISSCITLYASGQLSRVYVM